MQYFKIITSVDEEIKFVFYGDTVASIAKEFLSILPFSSHNKK